MTGVVQTTMTLLFWFSLSVSVPGQGKTLNDGKDAVLAFKDKNLLDWLIVTDLQTVLSALFAALFFPPAALLDAAHDRGSAPAWAEPGRLAAAATWVPFGRQQPWPWLLPTVAFSHLGRCLLRRAAISS